MAYIQGDLKQEKYQTPPPWLNNIRIINSCHGLLLCRFCYTRQKNHNPDYAVQEQNRDPNYVVLNPTTKQFKILPKCHLSGLKGLTLAFDPSKSPHYKVVSVCVCFRHTTSMLTYAVEYYHEIMTYSSETGSWKASGVTFAAKDREQYTSGVYWNGAVNWFSNWGKGDSVYYNVDEGRLGIIPLPPIPEGNDWYSREFRHYWESRGHLHLVEINSGMYRVDVYEMERDYSGWFVKVSADLYALEIPRDPLYCLFGILCVVRMERDEESFLVLHVPDKVLRYSFGDGTLEKICDVVAPQSSCSLRYSWFRSYQYIESLAGV
ncbi:hypothetical protein RHSIM_Rhsim03G0161800 [Rhododendron simsii]|uniref:F-box associated beta-propeller type 3 domain-containing protein n=1 Tax=Rhododendron simsii TaxID=118357 RepID=A0A834H4Y5_RHOSS|nr:hypothetical protein RHSIM_Rhsim03G0161800 [Rhododendron simsii]